MRLWKCRSVESQENQNQVFLASHRPWKSLRDSHIPTASTTMSLFTPKERTPDTTPTLQAHPSMRKCCTSPSLQGRDEKAEVVAKAGLTMGRRAWSYVLVNGGYMTVALTLMGAILGGWL